ALQTGIDRQLTAAIAGHAGQGEVWSGSWRWWEHRPRVAAGFAAPRVGWLGGLWRVDASWERQTYSADGSADSVREDRRQGLVSLRNWLTPTLRYDVRGGIDVWAGRDRRIVTGGSLEARLFHDRLSVQGTYDRWHSVSGGNAAFSAASALLTF